MRVKKMSIFSTEISEKFRFFQGVPQISISGAKISDDLFKLTLKFKFSVYRDKICHLQL